MQNVKPSGRMAACSINQNGYIAWRWIYVLAVMAIIFEATLTNWGAIAAIISATVLIIGLIINGCRLWKHKLALRNPFIASYESNENINKSLISPGTYITLQAKTRLRVEFILIRINGGGRIPIIEKLYDWSLGKNREIPNVSIAKSRDDIWHWVYQSPFNLIAKDKIRIGIEYKTSDSDSFDGQLIFELRIAEGNRIISLPFKI